MALFVIVALEESAGVIDAALSEKIHAENYYKIESGKWIVDTADVTAKAASEHLGFAASLSHVIFQ